MALIRLNSLLVPLPSGAKCGMGNSDDIQDPILLYLAAGLHSLVRKYGDPAGVIAGRTAVRFSVAFSLPYAARGGFYHLGGAVGELECRRNAVVRWEPSHFVGGRVEDMPGGGRRRGLRRGKWHGFKLSGEKLKFCLTCP